MLRTFWDHDTQAVFGREFSGRLQGVAIRVNGQWRICIRWIDTDAYDIEIVDYH